MTNLPNIKTKNGVVINGAHFYPEIALIIAVARETAPELTDDTVWITSANDGQHMHGSLHYENKAFDIRTRNIVDKDLFPGKIYKKNDLLFKIDPKDFEFALEREKQNLIKLENDLIVEAGQLSVILEELKLSNL